MTPTWVDVMISSVSTSETSAPPETVSSAAAVRVVPLSSVTSQTNSAPLSPAGTLPELVTGVV